jgi:D-alanyl-D-alanine carboxypeptidase
MKKIFRLISILSIVLFLNPTLSLSQTLTEKIDALTDSVMDHTKLPGMIVSVVSDDFKYEKAKGYEDVINKIPMRLDQVFRIGSVTKTFTITILLQLVDEGKLTLDDTINQFFPDFPNGKNITVRMLANMTSGIYNYSATKSFEDSLENHPLKRWTDQELVDLALKNPPYFDPGKSFYYSNTNTVLIGLIIEKLTGNSLADEIKKRIIIPLGLKNTYVPSNNLMEGDYSHGFNSGDSLVLPYEDFTIKYDPSWASAAGNILSNINDLKIYVKALANGNLVSKKSQKERLKWAWSVSNPGLDYGLGIFKMRESFLGHNGGIPGFTNLTVYSPQKKCSVIVMYNIQITNLSPDRLALRIIDLMNAK